MTLAIVKVLPVPVAPSSTALGLPAFRSEVSLSMAAGWSPVGWKSETTWNGREGGRHHLV